MTPLAKHAEAPPLPTYLLVEKEGVGAMAIFLRGSRQGTPNQKSQGKDGAELRPGVFAELCMRSWAPGVESLQSRVMQKPCVGLHFWAYDYSTVYSLTLSNFTERPLRQRLSSQEEWTRADQSPVLRGHLRSRTFDHL